MDEKRRMVLDLFDGGEGGQSGGEAAGGTGAGETVVYGKQEEDAPQDGAHGEGEPELVHAAATVVQPGGRGPAGLP